jgi:hypothetical protein
MNSPDYFKQLSPLKRLFWLYFFLLIFEGALRKWVVPQLSAPLLIVRDPIAIMIIWEAFRTRKWPSRWSTVISLMTVLLVGLFIVQIIAGDNPIIVGMYGLRSYLLPLPMIFIMAENLDEEDLHKLGACTLWLLLPMTALELAQYLAPAGSFLNNGAYEGGAQIAYTGAHVRPSGTFSFSIGVVDFGTLAGAIIFYGMFRKDFVKKWLLWASTFALILSVPAAGARTLVVQLGAVIGSVAIAGVMGVSQFGKLVRVIVPVVIVAFLASQLPVFSDAMQSMTKRFSDANEAEGGGSAEAAFISRMFEPAVNAFEQAASSNNWMGIGMGRGAAAMEALLHGQKFSAGEYEFSRELVEMGPFVGTAFFLFKVFLAIALLRAALAKVRDQEPLAMLMLPLAIIMLFYGVPEQPTEQGFMVISMAFCIAAAKIPELAVEQAPLILQQQLHRGQLKGGGALSQRVPPVRWHRESAKSSEGGANPMSQK